jgi:hypothetical protein
MGQEKRRNVGGEISLLFLVSARTNKRQQQEGAGRKDLGEAIQLCGDWSMTGWIRKDEQEVENENGR